ncbi:hypothetical protein AKJ16_DCAP07930 [Drosera capensis]
MLGCIVVRQYRLLGLPSSCREKSMHSPKLREYISSSRSHRMEQPDMLLATSVPPYLKGKPILALREVTKPRSWFCCHHSEQKYRDSLKKESTSSLF